MRVREERQPTYKRERGENVAVELPENASRQLFLSLRIVEIGMSGHGRGRMGDGPNTSLGYETIASAFIIARQRAVRNASQKFLPLVSYIVYG